MIFHTDIEKDTLKNKNYRKVVSTQANIQLVLMSLKPKEEIGNEIHKNIDQFFRIEKGKAKAIITDNITKEIKEYKLKDGSVIIIPKGTYHNIINVGKKDLKLYTIYSPPNHKDNIIQSEKPVSQDGGYYEKYLKYKSKYLKSIIK
jgi:mannose-6-phosphate isomerase-like protein (cupin superfamily)